MLQTANMAIKSKVLQTPSYLSHLWCDADYTRNQIFIGQEHMFKLDITSSLFVCWDVLVICLMVLLN